MSTAFAEPIQSISNTSNSPVCITQNPKISLSAIYGVAVHRRPVQLASEVLTFLRRGRGQIERKLASDTVIYGVNTGFGGNAHLVIPAEKMEQHQANLLTFLSAGTGESLSEDYVRAGQLMTLLALVRGWSAIRPEIAIALAEHINHGIVPNVPRHGSVGASGDLIPSAYIAGALCGRGTVRYASQEMSASEALRRAGLSSLTLQAKEGLALVNGTRVMTGIAALTVTRFDATFRAALGAVALASEALLASRHHYDARIHLMKGHPGQIAVAKALREFLAIAPGDEQNRDLKEQARKANQMREVVQLDSAMQEVYSIRCAPQVLGVVIESLDAADRTIAREAVSVNDNPLVDPDNGDILHGGNFMGNHIARTMDGIKLDIVAVANHMHAIMALLMDARFSRGLPHSLSANLGVSQGFKGVQISHTALVAHLRQESAPASIHTLPTEQYNQDIVSLGLHAATGAADMQTKLRDVVAMTLLASCQATDLRGIAGRLKGGTAELYHAVRNRIPVLQEDRAINVDIAAVSQMITREDLPLPHVDSISTDRAA
jgi:phenylalanine ammonia-lyase